ncbi:hypothetical protein [Saccharopolyspora griseoalba]|uniref:Uncharacterized protein n=1 Tax=Saccharopolyspora griseoalba TaxID=1431848 RepID=A0ABW2LPT8_9PSEU
MAVKIVHTELRQELRFGDRATAEHYVHHHGGPRAWRITTVPGRSPQRTEDRG